MSVTYPQGAGVGVGNYWGAVKQYFDRGGFANGLIPAQMGRVWFVNANTDADAADGRGPVGADDFNTGLSPFTPFATMERAFEFIRDYDIIVVDGVIREQLVAPNVFNITIIGGNTLTPRQATSGGVPTGGGASWLPPSSGAVATTPLLEITRAGWTLINLQMSPHSASACVRLTRDAVTDIIDASHARFINCYFSGGGTTPIGIEDNGGCGFVEINGCRFQNLTSGIKGLSTAAAVPLSWRIDNCRFQQNTNDITMSLSYAIIMWNNFMTAGSGATNKVISTTFVSAQGNNNHVCHNVFTNTAAQIANASGYNAGAADVWADNYCTDAVDYGIPA